jgi:hypothetical protein
LTGGRQRCSRCGLELPVSPAGSGFEESAVVEHQVVVNGDEMSALPLGARSTFPLCIKGE